MNNKVKILRTLLTLLCIATAVIMYSNPKEQVNPEGTNSLLNSYASAMFTKAETTSVIAGGLSYDMASAPVYQTPSKYQKGTGFSPQKYVLTPFSSDYIILRAKDNMVFVPGGNIELNSGVDPIWGDSIPMKLVAVSPFWMDETEVTNRQYREFVFYVRDSILRERLADPELGGDPRYKIYEQDPETGQVLSEKINWQRKIPWDKPTEREAEAIVSVLSGAPFAEGLQIDLLNYKYNWFDDKSYYNALVELKKNNVESVTISKDTAYFDAAGNIVRETLIRQSEGELIDFTNTYVVNVYPDVFSWMTDFANAKNEQYMKNYFTAAGFDNYPVIGVTWEQSDAFCAWRTDLFRRNNPKLDEYETYRLPTEAEWAFAARNGLSDLSYPWIADGATSDEGLALANFRGSIDLKDLVTPVATYYPNLFGLYDMAGNVAEWTSTAYSESVDLMSDVVNPDYSYRAVASDPDILKRKVVKGGSWKDTEIFTRADIRGIEYQNKGRSYIGFRCVRSWSLDKHGLLNLK